MEGTAAPLHTHGKEGGTALLIFTGLCGEKRKTFCFFFIAAFWTENKRNLGEKIFLGKRKTLTLFFRYFFVIFFILPWQRDYV